MTVSYWRFSGQLSRLVGRGLLAFTLLYGLARPALGAPQPVQAQPGNDRLAEPAPAAQKQEIYKPLVVEASRRDTSPDLRSMPVKAAPSMRKFGSPLEIPNPRLPKALAASALNGAQAPQAGNAAQGRTLTSMPDPLWSFDGVGNLFGGWPPDTQGDIGENHYVQWINLHFAIWQIDKNAHTATLVYGPVPGTTLFSGFGGVCEGNNDGDPITLWDPFAKRWFMSQFALPFYPSGLYYQCIAVSTSSDPTGSWHRYEFQIPVNKMNDYPKFGVWPDAYYMTVNQFTAGTTWGGTGVAALEREAMLSGAPARMVYFDLFSVNSAFGGMLPADFDGLNQPVEGAPGYFAEWDDSSWISSVDALRVWKFHVDWLNPAASTFGSSGEPDWVIPTQDVDPNMCAMARNCIPQPGTSNRLDAISDRLMHRLQYRNYGNYETLVSNHTVDVDSTDRAGIHWFELRKDALGTDWTMYQQGVFSPDSSQRWMGSLALDHAGDLALGYSVSSSSVYPSVRYSGRLPGDPLGTLPQGENVIVAGSGSQTGSSRWGDYSMMGVDPQDDCTFWYTQEYVATTGTNTWKTHIGAFRFPDCKIGDQGTISGTVSSESSLPIANAQVRATLSLTQTFGTRSGSDGGYILNAPVGTYTMTASAFGYFSEVVTGVTVVTPTATLQDFTLEVAPTHVISGVVSDANTGWPLYAKVTATGVLVDPVWSDPVTGYYSMTLPEGTSYNFFTEAFVSGYQPRNVPVGMISSDITKNIPLEVDAASCAAPGYQLVITPSYSTTFESNDGGMVTSGVTSWAWGVINSGPGSGHSGTKAWATNPVGNYLNNENGTVGLALDLSGFAGQSPVIAWWQWLKSENRYDYASLEASQDGGSTWTTVYGPVTGDVDTTWSRHHVSLATSYAVADFKLRFKFTSDSSITNAGWYMDDLLVGPGSCQPQAGSLLVGTVSDANTDAGLHGAQVLSDSGELALTQNAPADPSQPDGFYTLFALQGTHTFTATYGTGYGSDIANLSIPLYQTVRQDFRLPAGMLAINPLAIQATMELGETLTRTLTLSNVGGLSADYSLVELEGGFVPLGPIQPPIFGVKPFKADLRTSQGLGAPALPEAPELAAGQVIRSWLPAGASGAYAVAYDSNDHSVWVSSPAAGWFGNDRLYEYDVAGLPTGRSWPHIPLHNAGPADLAFNWNTGKLWVMNVNTGIANCIFEIAPNSGYTGVSICPGSVSGFALSQRGLAYDPDNDTWFAGSFNDLMVHRFDDTGAILSSVNVGLPISGLAYNPDSQHLFVMISASVTRVYVLDVANNYAVLGQFAVSQGFGSFAGSGLELDCSGNLWATDLNTSQVYQFSSGEAADPCRGDVPWISTQPISGTIASSAQQPVNVRFDASVAEVDQPGDYKMLFKILENTPYRLANVPVTMTINPPPTWGKLGGSVLGVGYCQTSAQPLALIDVTIAASGGLTWTVQTDLTGHYQRWLDQANSPLTTTVSLPGYLPETVSGISVTAGVTTTVNFDLQPSLPCMSTYYFPLIGR